MSKGIGNPLGLSLNLGWLDPKGPMSQHDLPIPRLPVEELFPPQLGSQVLLSRFTSPRSYPPAAAKKSPF